MWPAGMIAMSRTWRWRCEAAGRRSPAWRSMSTTARMTARTSTLPTRLCQRRPPSSTGPVPRASPSNSPRPCPATPYVQALLVRAAYHTGKPMQMVLKASIDGFPVMVSMAASTAGPCKAKEIALSTESLCIFLYVGLVLRQSLRDDGLLPGLVVGAIFCESSRLAEAHICRRQWTPMSRPKISIKSLTATSARSGSEASLSAKPAWKCSWNSVQKRSKWSFITAPTRRRGSAAAANRLRKPGKAASPGPRGSACCRARWAPAGRNQRLRLPSEFLGSVAFCGNHGLTAKQ